ncbi:hypothetical protein L917_12890, partial [Phytophthora nicotianae]
MRLQTVDDMLTLDEALAFIAFCDDEIRDPMPKESVQGLRSSFMLDDIDDLLDPVVQGMISVESGNTPSPKPISSLPQQLTVSPTRPRKRIRSAMSSSTVLQRRKKAEIERLRQESKFLEMYLAQISKSTGQHKPLAITKGDELRSEWHHHAFTQYQQRHGSEQTNRNLKEALDKQMRVSKKLQRVLLKRNALDGMEYVRTLESPIFEGAHFDELMSDLEGEVDVTYANFHRMCLPLQDTMLYGNSELSYGERCKANGMEFTTTTPLSWPMTSAFTHVWNMLESSL